MRRLVGGLLWLAVMCRPDIQYAVSKLAQFADKPTQSAVVAGKRILKYLKGTLETGIEYSKENEAQFRKTYEKVLGEHAKECDQEEPELPDFVGFTDSDFAGCHKSRKSTSGGVIMLGNHIIKSWSTNQAVVALSSGEAEYYAMVKAASQAIGLQNMASELGVSYEQPIQLNTDASAAIGIATRIRSGQSETHRSQPAVATRESF